ncbi:MAG: 2-hydroxychromene-2-carboxylate isomerase [Methylobacteriaceae bacterium]|nr:2-hydroxychromene-2-carboxylate isomerase [Methylobacteriaceae bacterium]
MVRRITCYFTTVSPWAYIGHALFQRIAREHGLAVDWKPVNLGEIFPETGGLPLAKRAPARQRYRMFELQRWREKRGKTFHLHPKNWPFDCSLADRSVIAIVHSGKDAGDYIGGVFKAVFEEERNCADENVLADILSSCGHDARSVLKSARSPEIETLYKNNIAEALSAGVFGSPTYILDGELFWGQDRLELLDDALRSGRKAFSSAA